MSIISLRLIPKKKINNVVNKFQVHCCSNHHRRGTRHAHNKLLSITAPGSMTSRANPSHYAILANPRSHVIEHVTCGPCLGTILFTHRRFPPIPDHSKINGDACRDSGVDESPEIDLSGYDVQVQLDATAAGCSSVRMFILSNPLIFLCCQMRRYLAKTNTQSTIFAGRPDGDDKSCGYK